MELLKAPPGKTSGTATTVWVILDSFYSKVPLWFDSLFLHTKNPRARH